MIYLTKTPKEIKSFYMINRYRNDPKVSTFYSNLVKIPGGYATLTYEKVAFFDRNYKYHSRLAPAWPNNEITSIASTPEGVFIQVDCTVYRLSPYLCEQIGEFLCKGVDNLDSTQDYLVINHNNSEVSLYRDGKLKEIQLSNRERFFHSQFYYYIIDDQKLTIYDQADSSLVKTFPIKIHTWSSDPLNVDDINDVEQICYSPMNEELILIRSQNLLFSYPNECKDFHLLQSNYFHLLPEWDLILSINGAYLHLFSQQSLSLLAEIPINPDEPFDVFRMVIDQATIFIDTTEVTYYFDLSYLKFAILVASGLFSESDFSAFLLRNLYDPRLLCLIFLFYNPGQLEYDLLHYRR